MFGPHCTGQIFKMLGLPEEAGVIRRQGIDQGDQTLTRLIPHDVAEVVTIRAKPAGSHVFSQPCRYESLLTWAQIKTERLTGELAYGFKFPGTQLRNRSGRNQIRHPSSPLIS